MSRFFPFRVTITTKIFLLIGLLALGIGGLLIVSNYMVHRAMFDRYVAQTSNMVDAVHSLLLQFVEEQKAGEISLKAAQEKALRRVSGLKYGKDGYFWINDMDGKFLAHPLPNFLGRNTLNEADSRGTYYIREFIKTVKTQGEGFVWYHWPPDQERLKVSYVMGIPGWNWVLGGGVYVDTIEQEIRALWVKLALIGTLMFIAVLLLAAVIGHSISRPLLALNTALQKVAKNDLDVDVELGQRTDEIGDMARTVRVFIDNARRVAQIETEKAAMDRMKGDFISVVSHELRTPLTAIQSSLGLIIGTMSQNLPEKISRLLEIAYDNCKRLIVLVNDLLDIDMIASGKMRLDLGKERLSTLLEQTVEANTAYAEKFFVSLVAEPASNDAHILVDKTRIIQVLSNLISNACKFSPAGASVRIKTEIDGKIARISVIDQGPGIPEEFQGRIFQKFAQANSPLVKKAGGSGLGLNISKALVEKMEGAIGFDTIIGKGTTFWITLPCSPEHPFVKNVVSDPSREIS